MDGMKKRSRSPNRRYLYAHSQNKTRVRDVTLSRRRDCLFKAPVFELSRNSLWERRHRSLALYF